MSTVQLLLETDHWKMYKQHLRQKIIEYKMCIKLQAAFFIVCNIHIINIFIWYEYHYMPILANVTPYSSALADEKRQWQEV